MWRDPAVVKENDKKQTDMWALSVATTLRENRTLSGQRNLRRRGKRYGWHITMTIYIYLYKHTHLQTYISPYFTILIRSSKFLLGGWVERLLAEQAHTHTTDHTAIKNMKGGKKEDGYRYSQDMDCP